jgi:hypothetical protein
MSAPLEARLAPSLEGGDPLGEVLRALEEPDSVDGVLVRRRRLHAEELLGHGECQRCARRDPLREPLGRRHVLARGGHQVDQTG